MQTPNIERAGAVLSYWFGEGWEQQPASHWPQAKMGIWFRGGPQVDQEVKEKFGTDVDSIASGAYDSWMEHSHTTCLAGIILMDQYTRNVYRGSKQAFALDPKALSWSLHLLDTGRYKELTPCQRVFALLPLEHTEDLKMQQRCVAMFKEEVAEIQQQQPAEDWSFTLQSMQSCLEFAEGHERVIAKWGRFPHRNAVLGRQNTPEEEEGFASGSIPSW